MHEAAGADPSLDRPDNPGRADVADRSGRADRTDRAGDGNGWHAGGPTLREAGENAAIDAITALLPAGNEVLVGPGDDAAVLRVASGELVITVDLMIEGPDFRREWTTPHDLGVKAAASNLADVAAMGARPTALVIGLAVPDDITVAALERFTAGLTEGIRVMAPGCSVVGGDLSTAERIMVSVTAHGELDASSSPVLRSGARPGDTLALCGTLGRAAAGLERLFAVGPDRVSSTVLAQLAPIAPVAAGPRAAAAGAHAMMDVSDGLRRDAARLARASGVAIDLDLGLLAPLVRALAEEAGINDEDATRLVLDGGEDHSLLAAFANGSPLPEGFTPIGRVLAADERDASTAAGAVLVDGRPLAGAGGWDPYRRG